MRGFGIIAGIMMSIMGGYAFFMDMEIFVRLGWMLGVVFILNGLVLTLPTIREKIQAKKNEKKKALEASDQTASSTNRKKRKKHEPESEKKDNTNNVLGVLSLIVGALIFISGAAKTLSGMALLYVVGSCVMFYGWLPLSKMAKVLKKEEETSVSVKKKKKPVKKEEPKENQKTIVVCAVISLILGALAICNNFFEGISEDRLVAYNLVMQGVNGVLLTTNTYKKKAKAKK